MPPYISIITPVKSESRYIVECVNSLLNLDYPKNSYEIIIVLDKLAANDVENALKLFKNRIKVVKSEKMGSAANRNLGASIANEKAKYLAFTDADCIVSKGWLKSLVNRMEMAQKNEEENNIGCIGGLNPVPKTDNGFAQIAGAIEQTLIGGGRSSQGYMAEKERYVASIPNCNALYKKELWVKNRQNESLIIGQDGEFNYRLHKQGNRFLIIPDAVVWHHRPNNLKGYVKRMYNYGVASAKVFDLHPGIIRVRWYALLSLASMFIFILLLIMSFSSRFVLRMVFALVIIYLLALILTTMKVLIKTKKPIALLTPVLLFLQHSLYNIGFLIGLLK